MLHKYRYISRHNFPVAAGGSLTNQVAEIGGDGNKGKPPLRGGGAKVRKHGFRGVRRRKYGRWASEIRDVIKGERVWIGTYDTAEAAARAYDAKARKIHGSKAKTNFPLPADDRLGQGPAPPVAKSRAYTSSSNQRPTPTKTRRGARLGADDHGAAAHAQVQAQPPAASADVGGDPSGCPPLSTAVELGVAAAQLALNFTDGWEFEPYSRELLLGSVLALEYASEQPEHAAAADGYLWCF
ncbi:hypothetical protein ABZP36_012228 [Zizania latifolia]